MTLIYNVVGPGDASAILAAGGTVRYGIELNGAGGLLVGKNISVFKASLMKTGTPAGNITATVRRASDDAVVAAFNESIDSTTLTGAFALYTFRLSSPYTLVNLDKILVEFGGTGNVVIEVYSTDQFDGAITRRTRFTTVYATANATDIVGTIDDGGTVEVPSFSTGSVVRAEYNTGSLVRPQYSAPNQLEYPG